jgi:hypothetical protein
VNDIWLPRIICGGLLALALACLVAGQFQPQMNQQYGNVISTIAGGLLGYVTNAVLSKKTDTEPNQS